jgi:hypothetical protein
MLFSNMLFSKNFTSNIFRTTTINRYHNVTNLFDNTITLQQINIHDSNIESNAVIYINDYTLEEQLIMYPTIIVQESSRPPKPVIIDIE